MCWRHWKALGLNFRQWAAKNELKRRRLAGSDDATSLASRSAGNLSLFRSLDSSSAGKPVGPKPALGQKQTFNTQAKPTREEA